MVEFNVGEGASRAADIFAIHLHDKGNKRAREGEGREDVGALIVESGVIDRYEAHVVRSGRKGNFTQFERVQRFWNSIRGDIHGIYPFLGTKARVNRFPEFSR